MKCVKMNKQDNQKLPKEIPLGIYLFKVNYNPLEMMQIERIWMFFCTSSVRLMYVQFTSCVQGGDGVLVLSYLHLGRYLNRLLVLPSLFVNFKFVEIAQTIIEQFTCWQFCNSSNGYQKRPVASNGLRAHSLMVRL